MFTKTTLAVGTLFAVNAWLGQGVASAEPIITDRCTNQINFAFDPTVERGDQRHRRVYWKLSSTDDGWSRRLD